MPDPGQGTLLQAFGKFGCQHLHSPQRRVEARHIQGVDGERSLAALRASRPAGEPLAGPLRGIGKCLACDLHEFPVSVRQPHAISILGFESDRYGKIARA